MQDIKDYHIFTKIESVNKGWSSDRKYYIETADDRRLLLRVEDISEYDRKRPSKLLWLITTNDNMKA